MDLDVEMYNFWQEAKIGQSITIIGEGEGYNAIKILENCDIEDNWIKDGKNLRRKRQRPKNAIGGWNAQKQFRYSVELRPDKAGGGKAIKHYTIWRTQ